MIDPSSIAGRLSSAIGEVTDAPELFRQTAATSLCAALLGKRVSIEFAGKHLYPVLWVVLVGTSTRVRKTTTIEIIRNICAMVTTPRSLQLLPTAGSYEGLLTALAGSKKDNADRDLNQLSTAYWLINEFSTLISNVSKKYNTGLLETLTDIYDVPQRLARVTKTDGEVVLNQPVVNILAGTTPEWLTRGLNEDSLAGGFLPRFTFIPAGPSDVQLPFPGAMQLKDDLRDDLTWLATVQGTLTVSKSFRQVFVNQWTPFVEHIIDNSLAGPGLDAMLARLSPVFLKWGILSAITRRSDTLQKEDALRAMTFTTWQTVITKRMVEQELAFTHDERRRVKIIQMIRQRPQGIDHSSLLRFSKQSKGHFQKTIDTLLAAAVIKTVFDGRKTIYVLRTDQPTPPADKPRQEPEGQPQQDNGQ